MKRLRVQPLGLSERHRSQKRARSITTEAARHRCLIVAGGLVVFVPTRGRFRVNTTAPIVIRMAITGHMAGINIDSSKVEGAADRSEHRQAAGAVGKALKLWRKIRRHSLT